jgi:plasmid rolling circle replication initiator protein Rep
MSIIYFVELISILKYKKMWNMKRQNRIIDEIEKTKVSLTIFYVLGSLVAYGKTKAS